MYWKIYMQWKQIEGQSNKTSERIKDNKNSEKNTYIREPGFQPLVKHWQGQWQKYFRGQGTPKHRYHNWEGVLLQCCLPNLRRWQDRQGFNGKVDSYQDSFLWCVSWVHTLTLHAWVTWFLKKYMQRNKRNLHIVAHELSSKLILEIFHMKLEWSKKEHRKSFSEHPENVHP